MLSPQKEAAMSSLQRGALLPGFWRVCLGVAVIAAAMMWLTTARADPSSSLSTKTVTDLHPKSIVADPCKAQKPPSYCDKK
jgi:hypothetical protein